MRAEVGTRCCRRGKPLRTLASKKAVATYQSKRERERVGVFVASLAVVAAFPPAPDLQLDHQPHVQTHQSWWLLSKTESEYLSKKEARVETKASWKGSTIQSLAVRRRWLRRDEPRKSASSRGERLEISSASCLPAFLVSNPGKSGANSRAPVRVLQLDSTRPTVSVS